ncbi:prenyltransferase and squalene oxidase repeat domain-containing protein [Hirsutella rhossiliensis]|uniref:Protein farnesyltransferase subunit beta n=1 Tax=Hirsutella rhossiliensis TaxID=111463 RepID=A0A9P8MP80_9HYPO|nr:prenyltransferase and squalene oxidase repeat domain-containing protein [Hirsutella rhossiliensis]KAH0958750.1 prenyltransferase and squalene oxidase repeat domain-containing protein [Hirsutella rhossiliensis]
MRTRAGPSRTRPRIIFKHRTRHMAMDTTLEEAGGIPDIFTSSPPVRDALETESSMLQDETIDECLPFLTGEGHDYFNAHGVPHLYRDRHVKFLHKQLGTLPSMFMSADPSRPWIFYWCLAGLSLLGHDVESYRSRLVETVRPMQNETGGFGGGFGQTSHLATTYATVLSLCLVGGDEAYEVVDRRAMWRWLCSLKQPDGGFQMAIGGEEDVRGAYCAAVIISLLNIPLSLSPDSPACAAGHAGLFSGLGEWVRRCQTYEGGVSAKPGVEAHGAYAFCALGCLSILDPPHQAVPRYLDVPRLVSWLSARQYAPEGGFSGRTNKLVDGCYSHWVGGCWPLLEASLRGPERPAAETADHLSMQADNSLFSRNGLIRYILCCGQDMSKRGGMRDKPSKYSDAYHTCYVLSGLSSAQHKWNLARAGADETAMGGEVWTVSTYDKGEQIFDEQDRVRPTHPVYAIPQENADDCQNYFASKPGF